MNERGVRLGTDGGGALVGLAGGQHAGAGLGVLEGHEPEVVVDTAEIRGDEGAPARHRRAEMENARRPFEDLFRGARAIRRDAPDRGPRAIVARLLALLLAMLDPIDR